MSTTTIAPIEDFGERIDGAKKHYGAAYYDKMQLAREYDVLAQPLSKSWPEPDYQKLLDNGADPWIVGFIRAARDEIPLKPQQSYAQKTWAANVIGLRGFALDILSGKTTKERLIAHLAKPEFSKVDRVLSTKIALYEAAGHGRSLKGIQLNSGCYETYAGVKYDPPTTLWIIEKGYKAKGFDDWPYYLGAGKTPVEAIADFKAIVSKLEPRNTEAKQMKFDIYSTFGEPGVTIGKKIGKTRIKLHVCETSKEARRYVAEHSEELTALLQEKRKIPPERRAENAPRIGEDYRHDVDVTPELFSNTFGFRGVQFGNYVSNDKRQSDLNNAYDALLDLTGAFGIAPTLTSLNGNLGLAFGARGSGGFKAHYEREHVAMNLTRDAGAGSLAHELFHGLDNVSSRERGERHGFLSDAPEVLLQKTKAHGVLRDVSLPAEIVTLFGRVMAAIIESDVAARSTELDSKRSTPYYTKPTEMAARAFECCVIDMLAERGACNDYLANISPASAYDDGCCPYLTKDEIRLIRPLFEEWFAALANEPCLFDAQSTTRKILKSDALPGPELLDEVSSATTYLQQVLAGRGYFHAKLDKLVEAEITGNAEFSYAAQVEMAAVLSSFVRRCIEGREVDLVSFQEWATERAELFDRLAPYYPDAAIASEHKTAAFAMA